MKANEVRIGNYIDYETEREIVTMQITYEYIRLIHNGDKKFKPIELNEEWVLKFGKIEWLFKDSQGYFIVIKNKKTHIKYVNSLQNLHFALTNEELTL